MINKKNIFIVIVILLALGVAYLYLKPDTNQEELKVYTTEDFPNALQMMDEEILAIQLDRLNKEYELLDQEEQIYVRWINIGIFKKRMGDMEGAEKAWQNAVSYDSSQGLAHGNLAHLYFYDFKEYDKAEEYYKRAIEIRPDIYGYYTDLADLYRYKLTDKKDQIEGLILEGIDNAAGKIQQADYYVYLAKYFEREGDNMTKAKEYAQEAMELNPEVKDQVKNIL